MPLGLIGLAVGRLTLPATPASGKRFDGVSAILNALSLGPLISGLSSIGAAGLPWYVPAGQIILGLGAGGLLVRRQRGQAAPMLPVDLLRIETFRLSIMASIVSFAAQMLATVSLPFFFSHMLGYDAVRTGLLMTPWPAATAVLAPIGGRLSERYSGAKLSGIGSLLFGLGLLSLAFLPAGATPWDIAWRLALCGIGFGLFQTPNNQVMISGAPRHRSGGASGMQSTARLLGQSIGAAVAAIIFGLTAGYSLLLTMGIAAAFALAAAVLSIWR